MRYLSCKKGLALIVLLYSLINILAFTSDIDVNMFNTETLPLPTGITELPVSNSRSKIIADRYNNHILISFMDYNRVFVYENSNDSWSILQELLPADTTDVSSFGNSISITDNKIAVGAYRNQFHTFIYEFDGSQYSEVQRLTFNPDDYFTMPCEPYCSFNMEITADNLIIGLSGVNMISFEAAIFCRYINGRYQIRNNTHDSGIAVINSENDLAVLSGKWYGDEPGPGSFRSYPYIYNGSLWTLNNTFSDGSSMQDIDWYSNIRNNRVVGIEGTDLHLLDHDGAYWGITGSTNARDGHLNTSSIYSIHLNDDNLMYGNYLGSEFAICSLKNNDLIHHCEVQTTDNEKIFLLNDSFISHTIDTLKISTMPQLSANFVTETILIDTHYGLKLKNGSLGDYSVEWDFNNDGSVDSYMQNPIIEMAVTDEMDVLLTVYDETGNASHSIVKTVAIDKEDAGYYTRLDFYDWLSSSYDGVLNHFDFASDFNANSDYIFATFGYNTAYDIGCSIKTFKKFDSWGISSIQNPGFHSGFRVHSMISNSKILFQGTGIDNDMEREFKYYEIGDDGIPVFRKSTYVDYDNSKTYIDISDNYSVAKQGQSTLIFGEWQDSLFVDIQQETINGEIINARITDSHCFLSTVINDSFNISVYKNINDVWQLQNTFQDVDLTPQNYVSKSLGESILKYNDGFIVLHYYRTPYNSNEEYTREYHLLFFREMDNSWHIEEDLLINSSHTYLPVSDIGIGICNRFLAHRDIEEESVNLYYKNWDGEWELIEEIENPEQPFDSGFGDQIVITDEDILISAPTQQFSDSQGALYAFPLDRLYVGNDDEEIPVPELTGSLANYPNPFNPSTTFAYSIPENGDVEIAVYNIKGQKVSSLVNKHMQQGNHEILWEGKDSNDKNVSSGVYFYQLKLNGKALKTSKCVLLK